MDIELLYVRAHGMKTNYVTGRAMQRAIISQCFVLACGKMDVFRIGYNLHTGVALSYVRLLVLRQ